MSENAKWLGYVVAVCATVLLFCFLVFLGAQRQRDACRSVSKTEAEYVHCMHPTTQVQPR